MVGVGRWIRALLDCRVDGLELKVKIVAGIVAAVAVVVLLAVLVVALFGPIFAWLIWGDHAAIGALCLSVAIGGIASALAQVSKSE